MVTSRHDCFGLTDLDLLVEKIRRNSYSISSIFFEYSRLRNIRRWPAAVHDKTEHLFVVSILKIHKVPGTLLIAKLDPRTLKPAIQQALVQRTLVQRTLVQRALAQ